VAGAVFQQHDGNLSDIKNDLLLTALCGDVRVDALLKRMQVSSDCALVIATG
jgi:hypothetical protein